MHVSRNKCELIAECCLTGVEPEYDIYGIASIKGVDITKIINYYSYIQRRFIIMWGLTKGYISKSDKQNAERMYFEHATQMFYIALNDDRNGYTGIEDMIDITNEELEQINKYRELEEDIAYV